MDLRANAKYAIGQQVMAKPNRVACDDSPEGQRPYVMTVTGVRVEWGSHGVAEIRYLVVAANARDIEGECSMPEAALEPYED